MEENQHGKVELSLIQSNIIQAILTGSFNETGTLAYTEGVQKLVNTLDDQPFAIFVDNRALEGGTPEAYKLVQQHNEWLNDKKLIAKAILVQNSITYSLIETLSPSIKDLSVRSFESKDAALDWIHEMLNQ